MPNLNFKGTLVEGPTKNVYGKTTVVTAIFESDEKYPQKIAVDFLNKMADTASGLQSGKSYVIDCNVNGRQAKTGKYFTSINAWRVQDGDSATSAPSKKDDSNVPF